MLSGLEIDSCTTPVIPIRQKPWKAYSDLVLASFKPEMTVIRVCIKYIWASSSDAFKYVEYWKWLLIYLFLSSLQPAIEYKSLLDRLHRLEQDHLKRFLLVKQEEYFAKAYRQLAVIQRKELHSIFFTQITNATFKGELKLEAAKTLVEDYSKIQVIGW